MGREGTRTEEPAKKGRPRKIIASMLQKQTSGLYASSLLSHVPGLTHGYSTRALGDAREPHNQEKILGSIGFSVSRLVWLRQVHGVSVVLVDESDCGTVIPRADALVFVHAQGHREKIPILSVHTADCIPLLFVDPTARILAVAHAGWRGTLSAIAAVCVREMVQRGARSDRILVSMGPHIGACCYHVPESRCRRFFPNLRGVRHELEQRHGLWYLDLASVNVHQLIESGVHSQHIDLVTICTSCQVEEFFSYRKDGDSFGEMMGFLSFV